MIYRLYSEKFDRYIYTNILSYNGLIYVKLIHILCISCKFFWLVTATTSSANTNRNFSICIYMLLL